MGIARSLPLTAVLGFAAVVSAAPELSREDVFPSDRSVCAVRERRTTAERAIAPEASLRDADPFDRNSSTARGRIPGPPTPVIEPEVRGDLRVLRWEQIEARPLSAEIPLLIEDGTVGLTLRAECPDEDWELSVELLSEDGDLLACEDCPDAPAVGEARAGRGTTQMPSTDRPGWELAPGAYRFRVRARLADGAHGKGQGVTAGVTATLRRTAAVDVQSLLDLHFIHLPGSGFTAQLARESVKFAVFLEYLDERLAFAGLRIGRVTHVDLDRPEFSVISTWEQAGQMFETSAEVGLPRSLNVYCIEAFQAPLNPVVGLSGGIPGPLANGTRDSGVAIRMSTFVTCHDCIDAYASLVAHEIGHYLGFYHTSEARMDGWDPFLDTPECTSDFPYACQDYHHVMFPLIHAANKVWSLGQGRVAVTHPLVRTVPRVTGRAATGPTPLQAVAHPNPFEGSVALGVSEGRLAEVTLHDVRGRLVRRLDVSGLADRVEWDGREENGRPAAAGIYFARIRDAQGAAASLRLVKAR